MAVRYAVLQKIQDGDTVPEEFLLLLQKAVLLALQEGGKLSISEYRHAEERLYSRHRSPGKGSEEPL
jgi:hypothetical protein